MINSKQYSGLIGFLFVAAWAQLGFATAFLCLLGFAVFYAVAGVVVGELDLNDVQNRLRGTGSRSSGFSGPR